VSEKWERKYLVMILLSTAWSWFLLFYEFRSEMEGGESRASKRCREVGYRQTDIVWNKEVSKFGG
jgi:hypothetical protein